MTRLWLASASPRRREILSSLGIAFEVIVTNLDEAERPLETPVVYVARVAREKRLAAAAMLEERRQQGAILAADTTVALGERVLGKPASDEEARAMLSALSGHTHKVHTAISISHGDRTWEKVVTTEVDFAELSPTAIARYVATGESRDKAGAYGIQGMAGGFVTAVRGSYPNVVGLPTREVIEGLLEVSAITEWP